MLLDLIFFILTSSILIASATFLIISLNKIAHFLRISKFTSAFIIMAFATSAPELFIGISSGLSKTPELSLGNILGSCIIHFTLLAGLFILLGRGIKINNGKIGKDIYFVLFSILLLIILFLIGNSLSRIDGVILLSFFSLSYYRIFKKSKKYKAKLKKRTLKKSEIIIYSFTFIISLGILFVSSYYIVKFASAIAIDLKISNIIVGMFLLSLSTNLPELAFGFKAVKMGYKEMALGDLTGGTLTNIGLVIGIVSLISPITAPLNSFIVASIFLFVSAFIFITFMKSESEFKKIEGVSLILLYSLFMIIEFFIRG